MIPSVTDAGAASLAEQLLGTIDSGLIVLDREGRVVLWNAWLHRASGLAEIDVVGKPLFELAPRLRHGRLADAIADAFDAGASSVLSYRLNPPFFNLLLPDGRPMLQAVVVRPLCFRGQRMVLLQINDASAAAAREVALRNRRLAQYRAVVDAASDAILTTDADGIIQWMNQAAERQFGWSSAEAVGRPIGTLIDQPEYWPPPDLVEHMPPLELGARRKDGTALSVELSLGRWSSEGRPFITGILRDVSDRRRAREQLKAREQALQAAITAKNELLREVNHRIKNSLQLVSSLLVMQAGAVQDLKLRHHFNDACNRIQAIASVHKRLYQSDEFRYADFAVYLDELCADVVDAAGGHRVCAVTVDATPLALPLDQVVPLGLIANELLTNAIKHSAGDRAEVRITFGRQDGGLHLTVADRGPGFPSQFRLATAKSLGMRLVNRLVQQIGGRLDFRSGPGGTTLRVWLPQEPPLPSDSLLAQ